MNLPFENLKEHKQHGESMLPVALYSITSNEPGPILPYHWHNELELIYLDKGSATFTINEKVIALTEGTCLFVIGGQIHSGYSDISPGHYYSIVFDLEFLSHSFDACRQYLEGIQHAHYFIDSHLVDPTIISVVQMLINELSLKAFGYELAVKGYLLNFFSLLFKQNLYTPYATTHKLSLHTKKYILLKQLLSYIYANYSKKIRLTDLSKSVNLTPEYICKFFKDMTGSSVSTYITNYRLEKALNLLQTTSLNITEIALECGFENISYFNRVFKKFYNCTPTEFRKISPENT